MELLNLHGNKFQWFLIMAIKEFHLKVLAHQLIGKAQLQWYKKNSKRYLNNIFLYYYHVIFIKNINPLFLLPLRRYLGEGNVSSKKIIIHWILCETILVFLQTDCNVVSRAEIIKFTLVDIHGSKLFYYVVSTPRASLCDMRFERQLYWHSSENC